MRRFEPNYLWVLGKDLLLQLKKKGSLYDMPMEAQRGGGRIPPTYSQPRH